MKKIYRLCLIAGFAFAGAASASTGPTTTVSVNGQEILANQDRMTAYVFDVDQNGVSSCYGGCASAWPAILLGEGQTVSAPFGTTTRKDGTNQITYNGRPIYLFASDKNPGDILGNGLGGVWHIIPVQ